MMIKTALRYLTLISLCLIVSACGFHLRSPKELPPKFQQVYLQAHNPYSNLAALLKRMFKGLKIQMVDSPSQARYVFQIIDSHFDHDNPSITTSNQAITLTYRLWVKFQIKNNKGAVVFGPRELTATREVILNANQLFTNNISPLVKQQLDRRMSDLLYDQLISDQAHQALKG